jgi:hypothetical protein
MRNRGIALTAAEDLELYQVDIKSAYLNAHLPADRDVYISAQPGLPKRHEFGNELVCKLHKSIYGLADSGRLFSEKLVSFSRPTASAAHTATQPSTSRARADR